MRFAYDVSGVIQATQSGFDALRIDTPTRPRFLDLLMGDPLVSVAPDEVTETDSSLAVLFAANRIEFGNNAPFRIVFEGSVVLYGTVFSGRVWDSTSDLLGQPVLEGNANRDVQTNTLRVALTERSVGDILRKVAVAPPVFTPNGDAVNDEARVEFTVTQISEPRSFEVQILDLGGHRVRSLGSTEAGRRRVLRGLGRDRRLRRHRGARHIPGFHRHPDGDRVVPNDKDGTSRVLTIAGRPEEGKKT